MTNIALPELLAIAAIGGLIAGAIAGSKGHSFLGYFVLGALLPLVGILLALVVPRAGGRVLSQLTPAANEGWWRDPTGRFDHRFYDGHRWTRFVGRGGQTFEDPI